jgi:hypothetical protein
MNQMGYKAYSDGYLMSLTKDQIIELLRVAEHNFFATEEALNNSAKAGMEIAEKYDKAKELLKLTIDTNYSLHKSCYNCSHFTSDRNCDIGKYLYGTGEKECEWEWKHMGEIINFLHD